MEPAILISLLLSFVICLFTMPLWIKKTAKIGMLWEDMNKFGKPKNVASSGGIVVVMGFVISMLYYVGVRTFLFNQKNGVSLELFALMSVILIFVLIGIVDDFLGWERGGLSIRLRIILAFIASIPLVVINAGVSSMSLPFIGSINLGIIYPMVLIPLGIAGASITYNFLAGFNGLEAGQGILILSFLSYVAYINNVEWLALTGLIMVSSLAAFYVYNRNPCLVFPGDSLTWSIGALIAGMAIIGNFEKIAAIVFIPYLIEMVLKVRGKLQKQSFGEPSEDGSLDLKYNKIYGLTHFSIWFLKKVKPSKKVYENDVVYMIHGIQIIFILIAWVFFV